MTRILPLFLALAVLGGISACGDKAPEQQATAPAPLPAPVVETPATKAPPPPAARVAPPTVLAPAPGPKRLSAAAAHAPAPPDAHAGLTNFQGVIAKVPASWVRQQPANTMRLAQFATPPRR